jgi:hypothetical protein
VVIALAFLLGIIAVTVPIFAMIALASLAPLPRARWRELLA